MDTQLNVAFGPQIAAAAARHHLDPRLLAAVAAQETGGPGSDSGRNVVGDGGHGRGLFQIDDRWHEFARTPGAMDPARNADYAAGMLSGNLQRYGGDVHAALSAYNAGSPTAVGTRTDWGDGRPVGYADSVLRHYARLGGCAPPPSQSSPPTAPAVAGLGAAAPAASGSTNDPQQTAAQTLGAPMLPLSLPQHAPLPQVDARDRNLAPAALGDDDPSVPDASA